MDWIEFFEAHSIPYVTRGTNTRRDHASIQCPWCGDDDPSEHLSVSLVEEAFGCWRNVGHGGRKPYRLIAALLGTSFNQAKVIAAQYSAADPGTLTSLGDGLLSLNQASEAPKAIEALTLPNAFKAIKNEGNTKRFWRYLEERGFEVKALCKEYNLTCCQTGRWKDRVIIPIYQDQELIGWTGRAIAANPVNAPRYDSSTDAIKRTVYNEDNLEGKKLVIAEGPFDALKLDFYGKEHGLRATCLFGVNFTVDQIAILKRVMKRFDEGIIMMDKEASEAAFHLADWLGLSNVTIQAVPEGVKDPGMMTEKQVLQLLTMNK